MTSRTLGIKFWVINGIAIFIVVAYVGMALYSYLMGQIDSIDATRAIYQATPFQAMFMVAVFYLFNEGRLIHKVVVAKEIKNCNISKEFDLVHNASKEKLEIPKISVTKGD